MSLWRLYESMKQLVTVKVLSSVTDEYGYRKEVYEEKTAYALIIEYMPSELDIREGEIPTYVSQIMMAVPETWYATDGTQIDVSLGMSVIVNGIEYKVAERVDSRQNLIMWRLVRLPSEG